MLNHILISFLFKTIVESPLIYLIRSITNYVKYCIFESMETRSLWWSIFCSLTDKTINSYDMKHIMVLYLQLEHKSFTPTQFSRIGRLLRDSNNHDTRTAVYSTQEKESAAGGWQNKIRQTVVIDTSVNRVHSGEIRLNGPKKYIE